MKDFIKNVTSQLGLTEDQATSATGGVLDMLKDKLPAGDFNEVLEKVPGASDLVGKGGDEGGGGKLGGMLGSAASSLGGKLGGALGAVDMLKKSGLDASKAGDFVSMFTGYLKEKVGGDLFERIMGQVPQLKQLVG